MEMHELEQAWNGLDRRLDAQAQTLRQIRHGRAIDGARARLRLVSIGQLVQLAVGIAIVLWAGGYWVGHLGQSHLVVYGVAIHLYGLGLLIVAVLQLARLARIDYRKPVLQVQRELVALRRLRIASERVLIVAATVVWVPAVFALAAAFGIDVWQSSPATVWLNLGVGAALAALAGWLLHRYRDAFERDATGRALAEVEAELAELAEVGQG
jgi:MFS family permease